ncbi:MAG: outer membrane beta-barrel protein [Gemmatimonadetes bacterium]|nr:outer membrane beta-barrel protein [Gemmatimonadota bacterium]
MARSWTGCAALAAAFAAPMAVVASAGAQELGVAVNPYVGYYHFDESSFEDAFENVDVDADPIYGVRLALGGHTGWSLDLGYGRTGVEGSVVADDIVIDEDSTIDLFYGALDYHLPIPVLDLFVSGGVGAIRYEPDDRDGQTDVLVNYGAGATIPLGLFRFRADVKDQVDLCDAPEEDELADFDFGACLEDQALHNIELSAGLEIGL